MKKILFIEDEQALQKGFEEFLKKEGYQMISALDGEIGLRLAKEIVPDLILLDLILPKRHGLELLKQLKEDPLTNEIPVIILTNVEKLEDINNALELGATTYLVKTKYTLAEVLDKVKKALGE